MTTGGLIVTPQQKQSKAIRLEADLYNEEVLSDNTSIITPKVFHYYINHCCDPNAFDLSRSLTSTHYIAWRDIQAQEEITTDYGMIGANIARCLCNSPRCRGHITLDDWKLPDLQQRYQGYFPLHTEQQIQQANTPEELRE